MSTLAPIILFVYNRPWHTQQVLEALSQNVLADKSMLYIYSDGPKIHTPENTLSQIKEVRNIIRQKQWCKEVIIKERDHNLGLANSVIQGVTEVLETHGKVIVLEDDILTGKYFLEFMNDGLEMYKDEPKVFGVSGYQFSPLTPIKKTTYFLPIMSSWGYGTWLNSWREINFNGKELLQTVESRNISRKLDFGSLYFYQMLKDQVIGKNNSWAVRFQVSMFLKGGLFLYPNKSLLKNIGFDGTGVHCGSSPSLHYKNEKSIDSFPKIEKQRVILEKGVKQNIKKGSFGSSKKNKTGLKKTLKTFLKRGLKKIIKYNFGWFLFKPLAYFGNFLYLSRKSYLKNNIITLKNSKTSNVASVEFEMITKEGPFQGLAYASMKSVGSSLYPKLIGSYEKELWPIINDFKSNDYSDIIDIGCAEGYYAVGLARIFKKAKIFAYDINEEARKLCLKMANLNQVDDRLKVYSYCTAEMLGKFNFQGKGLIMCDCEGFEKELFNRENIKNLEGCDLIIETHDFIDIDISLKIKELFKLTHDIISIKSIDDIEKAHTYQFEVLENLSLKDKLYYLSENRPAIMEWVVCKSRMKTLNKL